MVLREHGFSLDDIRAWGGEISYDQPMANHPSRMGRLGRGEIDAIFDEGIVLWADLLAAAGAQGLRPALIEKAATRRWPPTYRPWTTAVEESPVTPLDVPPHPQGAAIWRELGYLLILACG